MPIEGRRSLHFHRHRSQYMLSIVTYFDLVFNCFKRHLLFIYSKILLTAMFVNSDFGRCHIFFTYCPQVKKLHNELCQNCLNWLANFFFSRKNNHGTVYHFFSTIFVVWSSLFCYNCIEFQIDQKMRQSSWLIKQLFWCTIWSPFWSGFCSVFFFADI